MIWACIYTYVHMYMLAARNKAKEWLICGAPALALQAVGTSYKLAPQWPTFEEGSLRTLTVDDVHPA